MKIHLLGTAAAKPVPRFFCTCRGCTVSRAEGGKSLRTRSSTSIYLGDDGPGTVRYKVDLGPDANHHAIQFGETLDHLEHLLYTHAHDDHVCTYWLSLRRQCISDINDLVPLHLWGNWRVRECLESEAGIDFDAGRMTFHEIEALSSFQAGELAVQTLAACHPGTDPCLNFVITVEEKTVLLAWDTGYWSEETWVAAAGMRFDAVIMELTVNGPDGQPAGESHLSPESFLRMKQRLTDEGMIANDTPFISTHMGDNGQFSHSEAVAYWTPHGVTVGYDGLLTEV